MKTQTFIKEVEQLGFYTLTDGKDIYIFDREISEEELYYEDDTYAIATIETDEYKDFVIKGKFIDRDTDVTKIYSLFKLIMEYTNTPVEERKEEKKYWLEHRFLESNPLKYLNFNRELGIFKLNTITQSENSQTQFTQEEIDEIKERYNTTLDDFEQTEVKEWKN